MDLPQTFTLENNCGSMFIEPRTDGGIGIYYDLTKEAKSVAMPLSKNELIKMMGWLITWIGANK